MGKNSRSPARASADPERELRRLRRDNEQLRARLSYAIDKEITLLDRLIQYKQILKEHGLEIP